MATLDPILEARLREMDLAHTRALAAMERRIEEEHAARRQLDVDLFGNRNRPNDVGRLGELQLQLKNLHEEVRSAKLWLQGLIGTLLVTVIGTIIAILLSHR